MDDRTEHKLHKVMLRREL